MYQKDALAYALARAFEKQTEVLPVTSDARSIPSVQGIRGVLQAVQDQTSSFDWRVILLAVASRSEIPEGEM